MHQASESEQLKSIESLLATFAGLRPRRVDPAHYSSKTQVPAKVAALRAGLLYRIVELASGSIQSLRAGQLAAAVVLARAVLETVAALWFATRKIELALETKCAAPLDEDLMRLLLGFKANKPTTEAPEAINVMTFFKHIGKEVREMELVYADLAEYAHPNWAGTTSLYSRPDLVNRRLDFSTTETNASVALLTRTALEISLVTFKEFHKRTDALMPKLIELVENARHGQPSERQ